MGDEVRGQKVVPQLEEVGGGGQSPCARKCEVINIRRLFWRLAASGRSSSAM